MNQRRMSMGRQLVGTGEHGPQPGIDGRLDGGDDGGPPGGGQRRGSPRQRQIKQRTVEDGLVLGGEGGAHGGERGCLVVSRGGEVNGGVERGVGNGLGRGESLVKGLQVERRVAN